MGGGEWTVSDGLKLVAWTTTPWTVLANVALTANPDMVYRVVQHPDPERAHELDKAVPFLLETGGEKTLIDLRDQPVLARFRGRDLEGLRYDRPFQVPVEASEIPVEAQA